MCRKIVCLSLLFVSSQLFAASGHDSDLTMKNWASHPSIVAIRDMYKETNANRKSGTYTTERRRFDVRSAQCGDEPVRELILVRDDRQRVRLFVKVSVSRKGEPYSVHRYYDASGKLRFVSSGSIMVSYRNYLDKSGKVFWSLEKDYMKYRPGKLDNNSGLISPLRAKDTPALFHAAQSCPSIDKD